MVVNNLWRQSRGSYDWVSEIVLSHQQFFFFKRDLFAFNWVNFESEYIR